MPYAARKWGERIISVIKYLLAGYIMLAGALTPFSTVAPASDSPLGILYTSHISLAIIGAIIFVSGAMLMYGKIRKSKKWVGRGLFAIYLCFVFAGVLNAVAYNGAYWIGNAIGASITGALWLRWKFKTEYISKNHFKSDIKQLKASQ